ncbi:hypothetical protein ACTMU2_24835 [Cupriavidus basilensis]
MGDFTYLQNFFKAFAQANPQLEVHLWVDEVRRTSDPKAWEYLRKYSLYDWLAACPFFSRVYTRTYSSELYEASIREAQQEQYPIVVSLATLRPHQYANLARAISPDGFVVGMTRPVRFYQPHHLLAYRKPRRLDPTVQGRSGRAAAHQRRVRTLVPPGQRTGSQPGRALPVCRHSRAMATVCARTPSPHGRFAPRQELVFINPYAKTKKRCWTLEQVAALIRSDAAASALAR